jgi:hypothetical protein
MRQLTYRCSQGIALEGPCTGSIRSPWAGLAGSLVIAYTRGPATGSCKRLPVAAGKDRRGRPAPGRPESERKLCCPQMPGAHAGPSMPGSDRGRPSQAGLGQPRPRSLLVTSAPAPAGSPACVSRFSPAANFRLAGIHIRVPYLAGRERRRTAEAFLFCIVRVNSLPAGQSRLVTADSDRTKAAPGRASSAQPPRGYPGESPARSSSAASPGGTRAVSSVPCWP